jgi:KDO2-lipid IV(A) lauroyltransferase
MFSFFGTILFWILRKRRALTISNLTLAYPEKSKKEIYDLAKQCFKSVAKTVAEIFLLFTNKKQLEELILNKDEVMAKMHKVAANNKNGIIFVTAHFGNWEILSHFVALCGYPFIVIGREGDNKHIEKNLTKPFRERYGSQNIYKKEAMSKMVKTLKNQGNIGILIDQKTSKTNGAKGSFFGIECYSTTSVASMKLKYDPLILPLFAKREKNGRYTIMFEGAVSYAAEDKKDKDEKISTLTQHYNDILERAIREAPEQWFWMHDRWKI